jgi:hypothetical protein
LSERTCPRASSHGKLGWDTEHKSYQGVRGRRIAQRASADGTVR